MADLILSPIADNIIGSLGSAAVKEIASIWGVNEEIGELEETISTIKAVLLDAEEKQSHNHQVKNWLARLGDIVHEADDLMDEFDTEALRRQVMPGNEIAKQVRTFFSASNQLAFRCKMSRRIREIKVKLAAASKDQISLRLEERTSNQESRVVIRKRETHSFVPQDEVIGRDGDIEAIAKLLLEGQSEENVSVIPIVGMGGLGKTALAQRVFNDEKVQQHFELKGWVCVSENFDLKSIVQTIIKSRDVEMDQLQQDLRKMLSGKRYLLVLDDMWEENRENWLELKNLLIGGAEGSRVVVTTRSKLVAEITSPIEPYHLGVLDEEKSWNLFKKMAFRQRQEEKNSTLVGIGMEIVKRCGGVPLAIRTIGRMLYFKHSETEWSAFNKEVSSIQHQKGDDILPTLRLSYNNLASHLKHCFAYCRLFPKDYRIQVQDLIQLWMAQGFLMLSDTSHDQCLEDLGYGYFVDLFERSFFQESQIDEFGVIWSCKMHDLIHDLAIEVAGEEYAIVNSNSLGNISKNTRHASFHLNINSPRQIPTSMLQASKIRTVLLLKQHSWENTWNVNEAICAIISNFKQTRTLDLNNSGLKMVPDSISKLKRVRYLDLSGNHDIKTLPSSLTNQLNLQTLKLNYCSRLQELPRDIKKLVNLRHLEISGCYQLTHMPDGLGQLTNLRTLSDYVLPKSSSSVPRHGGKLNELMGLNNLRGELVISNLRHGKDAVVESESANLKEKKHLQSLCLLWDDSDEIEANIVEFEMSLEVLKPHPKLQKLNISSYGGVRFSNWLPSLTNLVRLRLSSCTKCEHLFPMSQFHSLKELELSDLTSLEYITNSNSDDNIFCSSLTLLPSLQKLWLNRLLNLKGWWKEYGVSGEENQHKPLPSFPQLTLLRIRDCPNLTCMPLYPHLEDGLTLINTRLKPFQQTILESTPSSTSSVSSLSKLKSLAIGEIEDLECLPDYFKSLTSLEGLEIGTCSQLKDLCPGILYLTSLRRLMIVDCGPELADTMLNAVMWKALNGRLKSLWLLNFRNVEVLPEGIQHVASLQTLRILRWDSLMTVPEWIGNLISLRYLNFGECPNLASLPEGIRSLTSLETLRIDWCPILSKRCQREIGEEWSKIAHIPNLDLNE